MVDWIGISGWIIGVVSLFVAIYEFAARKKIEKAIEEQKRKGFFDNLRKTLSVFMPFIPELDIKQAVDIVAKKYILEYLVANSTEDPSNLLFVWEKAAVDLGQILEKQSQKKNRNIPDGLSKYITFQFLSRYSKEKSRDFLDSIAKDNLEQNFARYYFSMGKSPESLSDLLKFYTDCSEEEVKEIIATLKGEELKRVVSLFADQKWNRRVVERIREYMRVREISYNSLVNKIIETNPAPKLFIVFKNEGSEPENEEEAESFRPVTNKLRDLRKKGKAELISPTASIYFLKDKLAVEDLLKSIPEGVDNNYALFSAEIDSLSINVRTSDRLEGHPAQLYFNLQKFEDLKTIYEAIILKLGLKPSHIIESADISFLVEPKSDELAIKLRKNSENILQDLSQFSHKSYSMLTDLRNMDEDDIGFLGDLISRKCKLLPSEGWAYSKRIFEEAKELYKAVYEPLE